LDLEKPLMKTDGSFQGSPVLVEGPLGNTRTGHDRTQYFYAGQRSRRSAYRPTGDGKWGRWRTTLALPHRQADAGQEKGASTDGSRCRRGAKPVRSARRGNQKGTPQFGFDRRTQIVRWTEDPDPGDRRSKSGAWPSRRGRTPHNLP